jgi:hypothetical protein
MSNYTYPIIPGKTVIGIRQTIVGSAFTGVAPTFPLVPGPGSGTASAAKFVGGMYTYGDPEDLSVVTLDAGGLFDLSNNYCLSLRCIRAFCGTGKIYNLYIQDRDGSNITTVLTSADADKTNREFAGTSLIVLPSQTVKITTNAAGTVDLYFCRYEYP